MASIKKKLKSIPIKIRTQLNKPVVLVSIFLTLTVISIVITGYLYYQQPQEILIAEVNNPTGTIDLALTPATLTTEPNTNYTLPITINTNNSNLTIVQVELEYDPEKLTVNSVTQGDFLPNSIISASIENGKVTFTYACTNSQTEGVNGQGTLAEISITTTNQDARLSFTTQTQAAIIGQYTDALHRATDTVIQMASANPSPSPSPSPSASPSPNPSPSPSPSPSASPDPSPSPSPSPSTDYTTSLKLDSNPTCYTASFSWTSANQAPAYYIDISPVSTFTNFKSSNKLSGNLNQHTIKDLNQNTNYYARITPANISDFPQFSPIISFATKDCSSLSTNSSPFPEPNLVKQTTTKIRQALKLKPEVTPSPTNSPSYNYLPSQNHNLIATPVNKPTENNFFQKIFLGWKRFLSQL